MSSTANPDDVKFVENNNPINPDTYDIPATSTPVFIIVASLAACILFLCMCSLILCACHTKKSTLGLQAHATLQKSISRRTLAPAPIPDRHIKSSLAEDINSTGYPLDPKTSAKTFKVYFAHAKSRNDELNLVKGDSVVINLVYQDGWCRGVSKRAGGPAFFPGNILGPEAASVIFKIFTKKQKQSVTSTVVSVAEPVVMNMANVSSMNDAYQQGYNNNNPSIQYVQQQQQQGYNPHQSMQSVQLLQQQPVIHVASDAHQTVYSHQPVQQQAFNPHESVQSFQSFHSVNSVQPQQGFYEQPSYAQPVDSVSPLQEGPK